MSVINGGVSSIDPHSPSWLDTSRLPGKSSFSGSPQTSMPVKIKGTILRPVWTECNYHHWMCHSIYLKTESRKSASDTHTFFFLVFAPFESYLSHSVTRWILILPENNGSWCHRDLIYIHRDDTPMLKHLILWQFTGGNEANFVRLMVNVTGLTPLFFYEG